MLPDWLEIAARFVQYAAALPLFGVPAFRLYNRQDIAAREARLLALAAGVLAIAGTMAALLLSILLHDDLAEALEPTHLWQVLGHLQAGQGLLARVALAALILLALLALSRRPAIPPAIPGALGALAVASFAWTGHGASGVGIAGLLHLLADIAHLLAAAVWLGALGVLLVVLCRSAMRDPAGQVEAHRLLARFSTLGLWAVSVLLLSGLVNTAFLVGLDGIGELLSDPYGLLLLAKTGLFLGMVLLAAGNRFLWVPGMGRDLQRGAASRSGLAVLRWSVGLEAALGVLAILAVAAIGRLPPIAS